MNAIQVMQQQLSAAWPGYEIELDAPLTATGSWFLDIRRDQKTLVVVEWREGRFEVATLDEHTFGGGPFKVASDKEEAFRIALEQVQAIHRQREASTVEIYPESTFDPAHWIVLPNRCGVLRADLERGCRCGANDWHFVLSDPGSGKGYDTRCIQCLPPKRPKQRNGGGMVQGDRIMGRINLETGEVEKVKEPKEG